MTCFLTDRRPSPHSKPRTVRQSFVSRQGKVCQVSSGVYSASLSEAVRKGRRKAPGGLV